MNEQTRAETFSHTWDSGLGEALGKLCSSHRITDLGTHLYRLGQQLFPEHTCQETEIWTDRTAYGSDYLLGPPACWAVAGSITRAISGGCECRSEVTPG